jgi:hypothetical protein
VPPRCFPTGARFQIAGDLAADPATGLVWQRYGGASGLIWMDATDYCAVQGMRLPSVKEAATIFDFTQSPNTAAVVDRTVFTNGAYSYWWTSSVQLGQYMSAWILDTNDGGIGGANYYIGTADTHCIR